MDKETEEIIRMIADVDSSPLARMFMYEQIEDYFSNTGNPLWAVAAFKLARRYGDEVPNWVNQWLETAFDEYLISNGKSDISKLLGFKNGKGQKAAFDALEEDLRKGEMMHEIYLLTTNFDISIKHAAEMVHARFIGDSASPIKETIETEYYRKWSKIIKHEEEERASDSFVQSLNLPELWTDEKKAQFLSLFPEHVKQYVLK